MAAVDVSTIYFSLIATAIVLAIYVTWKLTFWYRQSIPSEINLVLKVLKKPLHLVDSECFGKYGKIFGTYELLTPILMVSDPDVIEQIFVKDFNKFRDHRKWASEGQIGSKTLFLVPFEQWKIQRGILNSVFTLKKVADLKPVVDEEVDRLMAAFNPFAESGEQLDVTGQLTDFTQRVMTRLCLGVDGHNFDDETIGKYVTKLVNPKITVKRIATILVPKIAKLFDINFFDYESLVYLQKTIKKAMVLKANNISKQFDLINLMLGAELATQDQQTKLQKDEILDNAVQFMLPGILAMKVCLFNTVYLLSTHEDVQEKLSAEIDANINEHGNNISWEAINKMKYLEAVINESMRVLPINSRIERRVNCATTINSKTGKSIFLPKGAIVNISAEAMLDKDYWLEPNRFWPERFLEEDQEKFHPYAYFPFAVGPRICIGRHLALAIIKQTIVKVCSVMKFRKSDDTKVPLQFKKELIPIRMPVDVIVKLEKRI